MLYDLDRKGTILLYQPKRVEGNLAIGQAGGQWANWIGLSILIGVAYFLAARLSLLLLTKPDGVAVFWPASGVAAGVMIALGPPARWPVAIGAAVATIVANLMGDRSLLSAIVFALCNATEALLAGWLIHRYFGVNFSLDRLSHVLGLVTAAISSTTELHPYWLGIWLSASLIGAVVGGTLVVRESSLRSLRLIGTPLRKFALCLTPSLFGAVIMTAVHWASGNLHAIPGTWLLLYGCALISASDSFIVSDEREYFAIA